MRTGRRDPKKYPPRNPSSGPVSGLELNLAPTEVRCDFLKSSFFVVAVFLWPNRVIIRINMHREATRNPHMVPWGWGEGRKKILFIFPNVLRKKIFLFKNLSEL